MRLSKPSGQSKKPNHSHTSAHGRRRRRRLTCEACGKTLAYTKGEGEPPIFEFGDDDEPSSPKCADAQRTMACRFQVAERRSKAVEDMAAQWETAEEVCFATIFLPGRELSLREAMRLDPATEAQRMRRLLAKALRPLPMEERKAVRGIGMVEPGVIEFRENGRRVRRLVAIHAHVLVWGIPRKRLRRRLKEVVQTSKAVAIPLEVKNAPTPAGALGYLMKHQGDHRVQVREQGRKIFKRRPEGREIGVIRRWACSFPASDAEILIGLRRGNGLTAYGAGAASAAKKMARAARAMETPKPARSGSMTRCFGPLRRPAE